MGVKCSEIIMVLEEFAPVFLAEDWDNVGLLLGNRESEINKVMLCLDVTSRVVDEAIKQKVDLIISHHPLIFKSIKRVTCDDVLGRNIYKLIQNNIGVYCAHTNLDVTTDGVNEHLARTLGLSDVKNLNTYKAEKLYKIVVFVPEESVDNVREAMCKAGAGWIGNYSDCTFKVKGIGTFRPLEGTNPYIGTKGSLEEVSEYKLETIVPQKGLQRVIDCMMEAHPYEEVAYDVYPMAIDGKQYGMGKIGVLEEPQTLESFIAVLKEKLGTNYVRVIGGTEHNVKKVAVFCGSFDGNLSGVLKGKADVLVTGDIKYHTAQDILEMGICVIDAGHFNTEIIILEKIKELLNGKLSDLEVISNNVEYDPIKIT
ncbi:MAG: Nif3-like dinuclear metal center hexameric protein [Clostridia bacterium]|nr:Nif3-like dinuclear metal center hexameric protein [Clostridia bacterium]